MEKNTIRHNTLHTVYLDIVLKVSFCFIDAVRHIENSKTIVKTFIEVRNVTGAFTRHLGQYQV